ncbi:MAG: ABC-F family ATP-binding cassette domain-containing protein [Cyanobacteriota bacterium]
MLKITDLIKEYPNKKIFNGVNLFIGVKDKIGLIGPNGFGKTTLMKILMNEESYDSGSIYKAPNINITYLKQELPEFKNIKLIDEVKNTFPKIVELQKDINEIELEILNEKNEAKLETLLNTYTKIQQELDILDVYSLEVEMFKVLKGLGFREEDFEKKIGEFSGGWQMRLYLAKLLLQKPDLLLLDEPTNHLDMEAIEWLESYLASYENAFILISHDKRFLNKTVKKIVELESFLLEEYPGNYSDFEVLKKKRLETLVSEKERQEKEIKRVQDFIDRFRAKATKASQVKSREKMLAKIEHIEIAKENESIKFKFPLPKQTGRIVMKFKNLKKDFEGRNILDSKKELWIERGNKIAIIGANGVGKTTLIKMITGEEALTGGEIEFGHNVEFSYFAQNQAEKLNMENTVIDEVYDMVPEWPLTRVRTLLGCFLFKNEKVFQEIKTLSGGEKSRLAIAKMLLEPKNLLLIDEPTNHLDIYSKEVLIDALQDFPESIAVISHDRDFIARVCNKVLEISDKELKIYDGSYDFYLEEKNKELLKQENIQKEEKPEVEKQQQAKEYRNEQKEKQKNLASLEKNIIKIEERIKVIEKDLYDPDIYNDSSKMVKLNTEYSKLKTELEQKYEDWESLST